MVADLCGSHWTEHVSFLRVSGFLKISLSLALFLSLLSCSLPSPMQTSLYLAPKHRQSSPVILSPRVFNVGGRVCGLSLASREVGVGCREQRREREISLFFDSGERQLEREDLPVLWLSARDPFYMASPKRKSLFSEWRVSIERERAEEIRDREREWFRLISTWDT